MVRTRPPKESAHGSSKSLRKPWNRCKTHTHIVSIHDLGTCVPRVPKAPTLKMTNASYFHKESVNKRTLLITADRIHFWLQHFLRIVRLIPTTGYRTHLLHLCLLWQASLLRKAWNKRVGEKNLSKLLPSCSAWRASSGSMVRPWGRSRTFNASVHICAGRTAHGQLDGVVSSRSRFQAWHLRSFLSSA